MPFPNEHAARIKRPGQFDEFSRANDEGGDGVDFIFGIKIGPPRTSEIQSIRFDKEKFTVSEAKEWLKDHEFKAILFEEASDEGSSGGPSDYEIATAKAGIYSTPKKKKKKKKKGKSMFKFKGKRVDPGITHYLPNRKHRIEAKAAHEDDEEENGVVQGFAATFGEIDLVDEMFRKGAFAKSISDLQASGGVIPLMLVHFRDGGDVRDMIGTISGDALKETETGLFFTGAFEPDEESQRTRQKMVRGSVRQFSVGYQMIAWGFVNIGDRQILEHTEAKLLEVTATLKPLNPMAVLLQAKSMPQLEDETKKLCELLSIDPDQLTPENAGRLLSEHAGGEENAKAFSTGVHSLLSKIDGLLEAAKSQSTTDEDKAGGTKDADAASTEIQVADLNLMHEEIALRRRRVRL